MRKYIRTLVLLAAVTVMVCVTAGSAYAADQVKVHMINVGNGDSFLVEYDGHYALIDGGHSSNNSKKYRDGVKVNGACALDKVSGDYKKNLFSYFEHFDNDMKQLTGQNGTLQIIEAANSYVEDFDEAIEQYTQDPGNPGNALTEDEVTFYNDHLAAFQEAREQLSDNTYDDTPVKDFIKLQGTNLIKAEDRNSILFRYYTGLGYQFIYHQTDTYLQTEEYRQGGYNDCLTYLDKLGIRKLDYVILSHSHQDHVGGLSGVLANIDVDHIIWNGSSYGTGNFRIFEHELLDLAAGNRSEEIIADDDKNNQFVLGGKVLFTELGDTDLLPSFTEEPDEEDDDIGHTVNNQSLVYRMDFDGESVLFSGDAETGRQEKILKNYKALVDVDICKAAHHCHNNASSASFNDAMSPYFVLTSCGKDSEPHKTARKALGGADMWITKGHGDAVVATIAADSFKVTKEGGGALDPDYGHDLDYTVRASFGTPNVDKATFAAGGRTVSALRYTTTAIKYYNPPSAGTIKLTASHGWYYDKVQHQLCAGDKAFSTGNWKDGSSATMSGSFRGTAYFRFSNKYGKNFSRKTDGFETRSATSSIKGGKAVLYKYNAATVDWYPVTGAGKYKVWFKKGKKWKSKGTSTGIYKNITGLPAGKLVQIRIQAAGKKGYAYVNVRTLKKLSAPTVKKSGEKVKVSWKGVAGSTGYQVAVNSKVQATVTGTTSARLKVAKGKKLQYKVRACTVSNGQKVYAPWSKAKKFKLK